MRVLMNKIRSYGACLLVMALSFVGTAVFHKFEFASYILEAAPTATVVTCPASVTFTGRPVTPCTAIVVGSDGLRLVTAPLYVNNVSAGTATATYVYPGDTHHVSSGGTATFRIERRASATTPNE
jgi:hypothetical protein